MSYLEYEIYPKLRVLKPLFPADGTTVRDDWVLEGKVDMSPIILCLHEEVLPPLRPQQWRQSAL